MGERLQKYLARSGVSSRRGAERLIAAGRVRVNGAVVKTLGTMVEAGRDEVEVDGRPVVPSAGDRHLALHKPRGVMTTAADPEGRRTVLDLVPSDVRVYPVGRLDYDSEGLIILTNDGELAFKLSHPRHSVEKEYHVLVRGEIGEVGLRKLRVGVSLEGSATAPAEVEVAGRQDSLHWLRMTIHEGHNRQVRRMAEAVGLEVIRLIRTRIGPLALGDLPVGRWRCLDASEVMALGRTAR